ncbi:MAG: hypothetical protein K0A99_09060 [Desulfoarculaceae bacterium]|nr:hypothetical protein [Desulfoarculaceae bacterium]
MSLFSAPLIWRAKWSLFFLLLWSKQYCTIHGHNNEMIRKQQVLFDGFLLVVVCSSHKILVW